MSTDTRLHGVVIGAGQFAPYHIDAWARLPNVRISAICDLDPNKADDLAQRYGVTARFTDWREMIDSQQPDFVDIVTPPDTHHAMCVYAAKHGAHVICQKPLAPTAAGAAQVVRDMAGMPVRFMVHENWRWQPWYRKVRELLAADAIGEPFSLAFRMRTGEGSGPNAYMDRDISFWHRTRLLLQEVGVHFADTFRFLLGEVETVYARIQRNNKTLNGEDAAVVVLGFVDGPTATLDASRYNENTAANPRLTFGTMRLDGSAGHLLLDNDGSITVHPLGGIPELVDYEISEEGFAGDCVYATQHHFVDALQANLPFENDGDDYLRSVAVVEAAYESAETQTVVRLR
jgi:predicted dehydrogenase